MPQPQPQTHMCGMCEEIIPQNFDFCGFCAQETGFRTYPISRPAIGSLGVCQHGEVGIVSHVYTYSRDVQFDVDESHADVYGSRLCHATN